jgi:DNA-binding protein HU-beta
LIAERRAQSKQNSSNLAMLVRTATLPTDRAAVRTRRSPIVMRSRQWKMHFRPEKSGLSACAICGPALYCAPFCTDSSNYNQNFIPSIATPRMRLARMGTRNRIQRVSRESRTIASGPARIQFNQHLKEKSMAAAKQMTKSQLASHFADKFGFSKKQANEVLDEIAAVAVAQTRKNGAFVIPGVGKLVKASRKARMGRNPATGAAIKIPAKTVVKFRVAKACKDSIVPPKK